MSQDCSFGVLYRQALISYKIYLIMTPGAPLDMVALKWPDIAKAAIDKDDMSLKADLRWMIYEPIRNIYNATLERVTMTLGMAPGKFAEVSAGAYHLTSSDVGIINVRNTLVRNTDELLGIIHTVRNVAYPRLSPHLEGNLEDHSHS